MRAEQLATKEVKEQFIIGLNDAIATQAARINVDEERLFRALNPFVRDKVDEFTGERLKMVSDTVKEKTKETINEVFLEGGNAADAAVELERKIGSGTFASNAKTVAQTEMNRVSNSAFHEVNKKVGERVNARMWLSQRDGNVRPAHVRLDGQIVKVDEPFVEPVTQATAMSPGNFGVPKLDINCHCTTSPRLGSEAEAQDNKQMRARLWKKRKRELINRAQGLQDALEEAYRLQFEEVIVPTFESVFGIDFQSALD